MALLHLLGNAVMKLSGDVSHSVTERLETTRGEPAFQGRPSSNQIFEYSRNVSIAELYAATPGFLDDAKHWGRQFAERLIHQRSPTLVARRKLEELQLSSIVILVIESKPCFDTAEELLLWNL